MRAYQKLQHMIPEVMQLKAQGFTVTKIASVLGVTKQRVSQISQAAKVKAEIQAQWGWPFSTRTYNVMERMSIKNKEHALALYNSGHLHPNSIRGFGWVSYAEICEWLGVQMMHKRPGTIANICPYCGK